MLEPGRVEQTGGVGPKYAWEAKCERTGTTVIVVAEKANVSKALQAKGWTSRWQGATRIWQSPEGT